MHINNKVLGVFITLGFIGFLVLLFAVIGAFEQGSAISGAVTTMNVKSPITLWPLLLFLLAGSMVATPFVAPNFAESTWLRRETNSFINSVEKYDINEQLLDYIQKTSEKYPLNTIRSSLLKKGWDKEEVEDAINFFNSLNSYLKE